MLFTFTILRINVAFIRKFAASACEDFFLEHCTIQYIKCTIEILKSSQKYVAFDPIPPPP